MATASGNTEDKKMIRIFDHLQKYGEEEKLDVLLKDKAIKSQQISNLKAYLYERILHFIRQYNTNKINDIKIRELIDFAQVLFDRRLHAQAKTCLKKAKKLASLNNRLELQLEILRMEKNYLMQTVDQDIIRKVDAIIEEVRTLNSQINNINVFSNLSIKLNSLYTRMGFIKDESDFLRVKDFFNTNISSYTEEALSIPEKMYLYRLFLGYYFFIQDFENAYTYSIKLVKIFEENQALISGDLDFYVASLNHLLIAQYKLFHYNEFVQTNRKLQSVDQNSSVTINENLRIRLLKYYFMHEINQYFMTGEFDEGVREVLVKKYGELTDLISVLDIHSAMILNYKVACLYFGAGNYHQAIKWLYKIINQSNVDIREDLHCFARIINLVCHYELGNFDVIDHYIRSTYRFLLKKDDLRLFQKFLIDFIKNLGKTDTNKELTGKFDRLKSQLLPLLNSSYERRAFIYFDIISWLESKIEKRPVQEVIREKSVAKLK